jgi:hypothetical protein
MIVFWMLAVVVCKEKKKEEAKESLITRGDCFGRKKMGNCSFF